ncbi:MAG TPA: MFS transporter [Microbacterium sp.]|nr:MFS transporter [Microbacterium sp.]
MSHSPQNPQTLIQATGFSYFPIAFIARLPFAMMVVGVLTLVVSARGDVALGGLEAAVVGLGTAIFGPLIGAAADRWGQRPAVLLAGIVNSLALLAMAWVVFSPLPDAALLAVAFVIGATAPQVSPMSRSRLVGIIARALPVERRSRVLNGTMSYESTADELVFVFGPFIVGLLATTMDPAAPVVGAAVLTFVFASAFALHPTGRTPRARHRHEAEVQAPASELLRAPLVVTLIGILGMGLFFGAILTAFTAFMAAQGGAAQAGLYYGIMGVGSAILALGVAWFSPTFTLPARWLSFAAVLMLGTALLPVAGGLGGAALVAMSVVLFVLGCGVGPTLVTQYSIAAMHSPVGRSATVMTMMGSSVVVGQAAASAIVGIIAEDAGAQAALWAPVVAALVVLGAGVANRMLHRAPRTTAAGAAEPPASDAVADAG